MHNRKKYKRNKNKYIISNIQLREFPEREVINVGQKNQTNDEKYFLSYRNTCIPRNTGIKMD